MKRHRFSSFSMLELLLVLVVVAALVGGSIWILLKQKKMVTYSDVPSVSETERLDKAKPTLQNLGGIYLAAYNKATGLAGDLKFDRTLTEPARGIEYASVLFGQKITEPNQIERTSTGLEFRGLGKQVSLLAAIDGKVLFIKHQPITDDYQIVMARSDNAEWLVTYTHVASVQAKRGDHVVAGQVLGVAALYKNGTYWYGLQVNRSSSPTGDIIEYVCPTDLLSEDVRPAYVEGLNLFVRDWTTFRAKDVYGTQDGGCVQPVVKATDVIKTTE